MRDARRTMGAARCAMGRMFGATCNAAPVTRSVDVGTAEAVVRTLGPKPQEAMPRARIRARADQGVQACVRRSIPTAPRETRFPLPLLSSTPAAQAPLDGSWWDVQPVGVPAVGCAHCGPYYVMCETNGTPAALAPMRMPLPTVRSESALASISATVIGSENAPFANRA